jgi:hypothetical protein
VKNIFLLLAIKKAQLRKAPRDDEAAGPPSTPQPNHSTSYRMHAGPLFNAICDDLESMPYPTPNLSLATGIRLFIECQALYRPH